MSFMQPEVYESDFLYVDGPSGGTVIPTDVVDYHPDEELTQQATVIQMDGWVRVEYERDFPTPDALKDYTENRVVYCVERKHGWVGRMQAPGYMDCTDWESADSEAELVAQLKEYHGCSECGEFEDDCTCGKENGDA